MTGLPGRLMALDYGRRRIGIAVTDPTRTIAAPHGVLERPDRRAAATALPGRLISLIAEMAPAAIVVGIPLGMDGRVGAMAKEARAFGKAVGRVTGTRIVEWDERLTTARAKREIPAMNLPKSRRRDKGRADALAATFILEGHLRAGGRHGRVDGRHGRPADWHGPAADSESGGRG